MEDLLRLADEYTPFGDDNEASGGLTPPVPPVAEATPVPPVATPAPVKPTASHEQPTPVQATPNALPEGNASDYVPDFPEDAPGSGSAVVRGLATGAKGNVTGLGSAAKVFQLMTGGDDTTVAGRIAKNLSADPNAPQSDYDMRSKGVEDVDSVSSLLTYMGETMGSGLASTAPSLAGGLVGGAIGEGLGGPAGGAAGALAGAAGPSLVQGVGGMWDDFNQDAGVQRALKAGKITQQQLAKYSMGAGLVIGAIDAVGAQHLLPKSVVEEGAKNVARKYFIGQMLKTGAIDATTEGGTEGIQQIISEGVQALVGGNADLGKRTLSTVNATIGGALVGGPVGAASGAREVVAHNNNVDAHDATPPGVADPVAAPTDQSTPGGTGAAASPPAATAPTSPENHAKVPEPTAAVESLPAGTVASDVTAALTPAPAAEVTPQPAPAAPGEVQSPVAAPDVTTPAEPYQPDFAEEDLEDADPDADHGYSYDEDAVAEPAAVGNARAQAAEASSVAPAGTDEAVALQAKYAPQPSLSEQPSAPEPAPINGEVTDNGPTGEPQTAPAVPAEQPALQPVDAVNPEPAPTVDEPGAPEPTGLLDANDEPASPPADVAAAGDVSAAAATYTPAFDDNEDIAPGSVARAAPAVQESPAPVADAPAAIEAPAHTPVSRQIVDEVRQSLAQDTLSEDPAFDDHLDTLARHAAATIQPGEAPAAAVRRVAPVVAEALRVSVNDDIAARDVNQRTAREIQDERIAAEQERIRTRGTPQERARARKQGKEAAAIAAEPPETTMRRAKRDTTGNPHLAAFKEAYDERKKVKGGGREQAEKRAGPTARMQAAKDAMVAEARRSDAEKAAVTEVKREKVAETATLSRTEKQAIDMADDRTAATKAIAAARERNATVQPIIKAELDNHTADQLSRPGRVRDFVAAVKNAMAKAKAGTLGTSVSPTHSIEENLAVFANRMLHTGEGGMNASDVAAAKFFIDIGLPDEAMKVMANPQEAAEISYDAVKAPKLEEGEQDLDYDTETGLDGLSVNALQGEPNWQPTEAIVGSGADKVSFKTSHSLTGPEAVDYAMKLRPKRKGIMNVIRKMHNKQLKKLLGTTKVLFVNGDIFAAIGNKDARGVHILPTNDSLQNGGKGVVLINNEQFSQTGSDGAAYVLEHELTHAATVFAVRNNFRGTRDIINKMIASLRADGLQTRNEDLFFGHYGLTNPEEFISEAFTNPAFQLELSSREMPAEIARLVGVSDRAPSWWQAFTGFVAHALGLDGFGRKSQTYLQGLLALHPDLMMSDAEQSSENHKFIGDMALSDEYGDQVDPDYATHFLPMLKDASDRMEASTIGKVGGKLSSFGRWAMSKVTTEELKRRTTRDYFDGKADNVFSDEANLILSRDHMVKAERVEGDNLSAALAEYASKNKAEAETLSEELHNATLAQVDPTVPLAHPNNKHLSKKGDRNEVQRREHARIAAVYAGLSKDGKALWNDLTRHYAKKQNERVGLVVNNILDQAMDIGRIVKPAGISKADLADFVLNGGIDKDEADMSPTEKVLNATLGNTGKALKGSKEMRLIKGTYVPLTRYGKYFFTAREKVATPANAVRGEQTDDGQDFIFKDKKARRKYLQTTGDRVTNVFSRATDPTTGLTKDPVTGKPYKLGDNINYESRWYVRVANKSMEMADNEADLNARRKIYEKNGHTLTSNAELNNHLNASSGQILPEHIRRLMNNIDQSKASDAIKTANKAGVVDAYIRTMAGSRAQTKQLKRAGVGGYSKDLVRATLTNNGIIAGHLANLKLLPKLAKASDAMDKYVDDMRYANKDNVLGLQAAVSEIRRRRDAAYKYGENSVGQRLSNIVLGLSYMTHLATPAFSVANAMQPLATTGPVLAGHLGVGGAMRHMAKAMYEMGAISTYAQGIKQTGIEAAHFARSTGKLFSNLPRNEVSYHKRILDILTNSPDIEHREAKIAMVNRLQDLGYGADAGLDNADITELNKSRPEIALHRMGRVARQASEAVEAVNRYMTGLAAVSGAIEINHMNEKDAVNFAVSVVEQTQGGYSSANNPTAFSHPIGKIMLQFKKYGLMYAQLYYGALARSLPGRNLSAVDKKIARTQLAALSVMSTAMAGIGGYPLMEFARVLTMIGNGMGWLDNDWEDDENAMQAFLQRVMGGTAGEMAMHGLSRGVGVDLSTRLGNDSLVLFGTPHKPTAESTEAYLLEQLAGAPGGVVKDAIQAYTKGDWHKLPLPKFIKDAAKGYDMATADKTTASGATMLRKKTGFGWDSLLQGVTGLTPASTARQYETGGSGAAYKETQAKKAARTSTMQKWLNADPADRPKIWNKAISSYNVGKAGKDRITMDDLQRNAKRRATSAKKQEMAN